MTKKITPVMATLAFAFTLSTSLQVNALDPPEAKTADTTAPTAQAGTQAPSKLAEAAKPAPVTSKAPTNNPAWRVASEQPGLVPNLHTVHPFLYRGGEPTADGVKKLKELGVSTIIDLRAPNKDVADEARLARSLGMKTINLPMSNKAPTDAQVKTFLDAVQKAKDDPASGKAFVHCAHGSDRTGCLVGVWRVYKDGWSYEDAYKEMRKYFFGPQFTNLSGTVERYSKKDKPLASR